MIEADMAINGRMGVALISLAVGRVTLPRLHGDGSQGKVVHYTSMFL